MKIAPLSGGAMIHSSSSLCKTVVLKKLMLIKAQTRLPLLLLLLWQQFLQDAACAFEVKARDTYRPRS